MAHSTPFIFVFVAALLTNTLSYCSSEKVYCVTPTATSCLSCPHNNNCAYENISDVYILILNWFYWQFPNINRFLEMIMNMRTVDTKLLLVSTTEPSGEHLTVPIATSWGSQVFSSIQQGIVVFSWLRQTLCVITTCKEPMWQLHPNENLITTVHP